VSEPVSDEVLRVMAEHGLAYDSEIEAVAAELLAARERLRLADALAEAAIGRDRCAGECRVMRRCTCGDATLRRAIDAYRDAARSAR